MAVVLLPGSPLLQSANPMPLDYGSWQAPAMGGVITRLDRLGNRFAIACTTPRLKPEPDGRIWVSRLLQAVGGVVRIAFPQVGLSIGAPGAPLVDGANQAGSSLKMKQLAAGYDVREGQFFNIVDPAGANYLHQATADIVADGSGGLTIPIYPMLRISPADASPVNLAAPVIEGQLSGNDKGWTLERAGVDGLQFTITELK